MRLGSIRTPTSHRRPEDVTADEIRRRRVEVARRNSRWTEVEEVDLVPRGRVAAYS